MSTKDLFENYTAYTDALEMSHSAAADSTARTTPLCWTFQIPPFTSWTFDQTI